jgi:hypothetical protein
MTIKDFTCPCCGFLSFDEEPGSLEICRVCGWQDEVAGLRFALDSLVPNYVSLKVAQANFVLSGRFDLKPRKERTLEYQKDSSWRIISASDIFERFEGHIMKMNPVDPTELYYWRRPE